MTVSLIVAVSEDGIIGRNGQLPWRLSHDLRRFKRLTMGHHLVMGRRTYASIGRPLPGRTSIVISRNPQFQAPSCLVAADLSEAFEMAHGDPEVFVIGGRQIYELALPCADRLYWTQVHAQVEGDTCFPPIQWGQWKLIEEHPVAADERNEYASTFRLFQRAAK
jgi:dihydrofolate reductase